VTDVGFDLIDQNHRVAHDHPHQRDQLRDGAADLDPYAGSRPSRIDWSFGQIALVTSGG
jgi:hypothetical protein